ncbi:hypothetical protein [Marinoscillum sp.]|uniref:golvesin C-terminal-like domain-containing protein n=1 Tax=Marinoscillum sp. TaxID=2024838 RepID=UPI003BAA552C
MISLKNIWTISKYESLVLWRNWFFRIVALAGLGFVTIFSIAVFSQVDMPRWENLANSWLMPYAVMILISIPQIAAVVFLSTGLIKKDKKVDTNEVFFVRPISNLDYVLGKALALFKLFFTLNMVLLCIPMIVNLTNPDATFNPQSFVLYPLLMSVPSIIFTTGLGFLLVTLLRNQPIAIVLMIGAAGVQLIYYFDQFSNILDFSAFRLSLFISEIAGTVDMDFALRQRLFYFLIGMSCLVLTSFFLDRLASHRRAKIASGLLGLILIIGAATIMIQLWQMRQETLSKREAFITMNDQWINEPNITILAHDIDLHQLENSLQVTSSIYAKNINNQSLNKSYFSLNPSLVVQSIAINGATVPFHQELQMVWIDEIDWAPNETQQITIEYAGTIDASIAHLEVDQERYESANEFFMFSIQKEYAFLQSDYVLLTKDVLWYPDTPVGYNRVAPSKSRSAYIDFSLQVKPLPGLTPISQGSLVAGEESYTFQPEYPLPQISLAIGQYLKKELVVDSVAYSIYHYPAHDFFAEQLNELPDTLSFLIRDIANQYQADQQLAYPFRRLQLVEVPVQFAAYNKIYENHQAYLQPETVYWPEEGGEIRAYDFRRQMRDMNRQARQRNETLTEKEKQANIFNDLIKQELTKQSGATWFWSGSNADEADYSLFANYYDYNSGVISSDWPLLDRSIANYLRNDQQQQNDYSRNMNGISFAEECNQLMRESSFTEILTESDFKKIQKTVELKSQYLFAYLGYEIGEQAFRDFLTSWVSEHNHELTSYDQFRSAISDQFGLDIDPIIRKVYSDKSQAAFEVLNLQTYEVLDGDRKRFQVLLDIKNSGDNDGVLEVRFNTGEERRNNSDNDTPTDTEPGKLSIVKEGQAKQFGFLLDQRPNSVTINTIISKNIPSEINLSLRTASKKLSASLFDGERTISETAAEGQYQVIVDNEDEGFSTFSPIEPTYLRAYLDSRDTTEQQYYGNWFRSYSKWLATTGSDFYGRIVRSAHFTRSGKGEKLATWTPQLDEEGFYDLYVYLKGPNQNEYVGRGDNRQFNYYYQIHHGDGTDEIQYNLTNAEAGWNYLGSYYFHTNGGSVTQTDKSEFRTVYADAIKWVKQ